ncbi:acetyl-CoA sensor PanZ family protein [Acinetobacter populi]|jgi:GNAT superfamily N-acetyltransferase|uniref:GNAT family N-acetyltransferase n=1 Tax=Acinetobacter populi TaxID=1582270 RepID=A0A1Z9Z3L3_9GAMM|nr:acetyl-CoA sensor PanZ family protein [Acinetobacter populi]MCH4248097.1 PanM family protein [Acinetobacter populi]OUY09071.1 GNAT family N-acetyltransferase [Acinetobacter populi]
MPIQVEAVTDLKDVIVRNQIERLYETSPEFGDGQDAITQLDEALDQDTVLYTAVFNDKIIGAIWSEGTGTTRLLEYVVIHPANRGRGVADRLISETCRIEEAKGVTKFEPGCGAIHRCLVHLGKL